MTDPCKFEDDIKEIKDNVKDLVNVIKGVNATKPGLIHRVLANQKSISVQWWFIGGISLVIISTAIKTLFF